MRKHKNNIISTLKDGRSNRNRTDYVLEDKVHTLLHKFDMKREVFLVVN